MESFWSCKKFWYKRACNSRCCTVNLGRDTHLCTTEIFSLFSLFFSFYETENLPIIQSQKPLANYKETIERIERQVSCTCCWADGISWGAADRPWTEDSDQVLQAFSKESFPWNTVRLHTRRSGFPCFLY